MKNATAILEPYYGNDCPFKDKLYKIYSDGSHYIAREAVHTKAPKQTKRERLEIDDIFDMLYDEGVKADMSDYKTQNKRERKSGEKSELREYIRLNLEDCFPDFPDLEKYVEENTDRKNRNFWQREKRFRRKAYLNRWNYFVTFTYNGKKHTEETFRKKLRKCLSNLHTRRGWCFMGVWERGEKADRLHFHCIMYIPAGQMVGEVSKKREYSKRLGQVKETFSNDFFERKFGRNDFEELNVMEMKNGSAVNYLLKYLRKTGERIVYSRGVPTEINKTLPDYVFAVEIEDDYVTKYVIFDNVIQWERDIKPYTQRRRKRLAA